MKQVFYIIENKQQKLNNGHFSADFEHCKEHLVIENVLSTGSKIWESVKQAQKEQMFWLMVLLCFCFLHSTMREAWQEVKFFNQQKMICPCKQLDKCQQLLQLDTLMDALAILLPKGNRDSQTKAFSGLIEINHKNVKSKSLMW